MRLIIITFTLMVFVLCIWEFYPMDQPQEEQQIQDEKMPEAEEEEARILSDVGSETDAIALMWPTIDDILNALAEQESSMGVHLVGDGGKARGWLQQHEAHWKEGCEQLGLDWEWPGDTESYFMCRWVAIGYWMRHCPKHFREQNVEQLIRRFRLPYDPYRTDNNRYFNEVFEKLSAQSVDGRIKVLRDWFKSAVPAHVETYIAEALHQDGDEYFKRYTPDVLIQDILTYIAIQHKEASLAQGQGESS